MQIRFDAASVAFEGRIAVHPLSLSLAGRRVGIIGLNGSGKTSFARLINGLTKPAQGRVTVNGLDTVKDGAAVLRMVGFVFQNPQHQIVLPVVGDDIAFGLKGRGLSAAQIEAAALAVCERFGIAHLARRRTHELSGGELQLAALAALTVTEPDILILDEPTGQLDLKNRALVERAMAGLKQDLVVITHDLPLIESFERVLLFNEGRLCADAEPAEAIRIYRELALR